MRSSNYLVGRFFVLNKKRNKKITTYEEATEFYKKDNIKKGLLGDQYFYNTVIANSYPLLESCNVLQEAITATYIDTAEKMRKKTGSEVHVNMKMIEEAYDKLSKDYTHLSWAVARYERKRRKYMKSRNTQN